MFAFLVRLSLIAGLAALAPLAVTNVTFAADQTAAPRSEGEQLYRRGQYAEAVAWWTTEAAKGDIESARRLGIEFMDGKYGVIERDYKKARQYHLQAAMGGERRSMMDLGTIHENAMGVPEDLVEAARWFGWSAKYGYGPAQHNYAVMLETGEAGRKDEVEAYMWYELAAMYSAQVLPETKINLEKPPPDSSIGMLAAKLTPAQRAEARARAKKFVAMTGPLPASENR